MLDLADIADVIADAVKEATAPLLDRIDALEKREFPAPTAPDEEAIAERVLKALPPPQKGEPGEVDMIEIRGILDEAAAREVGRQLAEAIKALPAPEPVEPIAPDMEAIGKLIQDGIAKAAAELPKPEKGEPGIGLADALIDKDGQLVLTMTNGTTKTLGLVVGKDGERGKDGITPEFMDAEFAGRTLRLTFHQGEQSKSVEFQLSTPEYAGVFKESATYEPGDMVTWAGSCWHCDEPKGMKPGEPDSGWTLAVKAGRPGKDLTK
jgi:hypothetical protein